MSGLISQERATYTDIWSVPAYGDHSPGAQFVPAFLDMARIDPSTVGQLTVLDAGAGSGKGAVALADIGFCVSMVDITSAGLTPEAKALPFTEACLWHDLTAVGPADYVYCCDVLEHIPPAFTMLVIRRLLDVAREGVFLSISLVPDNFGIWVGKPLHQTVQPFTVWREQIAAIGHVAECRDLIDVGLYYVEPR